jgi:DNA helicase HerA-like ATPase
MTAHELTSVRAFACGMSGSGKSTLLRQLFIERAPRVLIVDATGEWDRAGDNVTAVGLEETLVQLRAAARRKRWRLVASLDPEEVGELARLLVPAQNARAGLVRALGGCALALDETDLIAPQGAPPEIRALWQRGRHAGLSIFAATQSPALVHRIVTGQSRWLAVCRVSEPRELEYLARTLPRAAADQLERLDGFQAVLLDRDSRRSYLLELRRDAPPRIMRELTAGAAPLRALAGAG